MLVFTLRDMSRVGVYVKVYGMFRYFFHRVYRLEYMTRICDTLTV